VGKHIKHLHIVIQDTAIVNQFQVSTVHHYYQLLLLSN